jgi:pimeloyl-ACP methyl ester carboxylesterase
MKTDVLNLGGLSIAVHQSTGSGAPIVLVHGNSLSSRVFERQLEGALGRARRLVAVDLPGHGASSWAGEPAATYTLPGYARVVAEVARRLDLSGALFFGWSLGGHVLLEASDALPQPIGMAIMGTPPLGFPPAMDRAFVQLPTLAVAFSEEASEETLREYLTTLVKPGAQVPQVFADEFRRTDPRTRSALAASIGPNGYRDELEAAANLGIPLAIFHGAHERIVNGAYFEGLSLPTLWRGAVHPIAGAGHAAHWEAPAAFDALLEAFARECAR